MTVIRAFIAFDLNPPIYRKLSEISAQLQQQLKNAPIRWVPVENIHLTLKFLGDVSVMNLEVLKKILSAEAACHRTFEITVKDVGAFPSPRRPRVIWVGVDAPPELVSVQKGIEDETGRLGYAQEERSFSPHLTLGRVSRNATSQDSHRISEVLSTLDVGVLGTMQVQFVHLYKSDLQPGGAVYSQLFSAGLGVGT